MKKVFYLALVMGAIVLTAGCSGNPGKEELLPPRDISKYTHVLIPAETLEETGFEHFGEYAFDLAFKGDCLYLLNYNDYLIAKFDTRSMKPLRTFKSAEGQAPQEMLVPRSLFFVDNKVAVFDIGKRNILFFNLELDYVEEIKIEKNFTKIYCNGQKLMAMLYYKDKDVIGFLDSRFEVVESFVQANKKIPFDRFYPMLLNMVYFLNGQEVAHGYYVFPYKRCEVAIYHIPSKKKLMTLSWDQPFSPTQKDVSARENNYISYYTGKHGRYYVVETSTFKNLRSKEIFNLLVFDERGRLLLLQEFPYRFLNYTTDRDDPRVYFMDDNENISYMDIPGLMK